MIDFHQHILPKEYMKVIDDLKVISQGGFKYPDWSAEAAIENMDKAGTEKTIIYLSEPGTFFNNDEELAKRLSRMVNEICKKTVDVFPGRFGAFGVLPMPFTDSSLKEIEYIFDTLGLDGIAMLTNIDGMYPGAEAYEEVFAELNRRKAIVVFHPALPPAGMVSKIPIPGFMLEFPFETTRCITNILITGSAEKYRDIRWLFTHAGGAMPYLAQRFEYMRTRGFFPEIEESTPRGANASLQDFYYDTALSYGDGTFALLEKFVGLDHILFGSDWPFAPVNYTIEAANNIDKYWGVNERIRNMVKRENALYLLSTSNKG